MTLYQVLGAAVIIGGFIMGALRLMLAPVNVKLEGIVQNQHAIRAHGEAAAVHASEMASAVGRLGIVESKLDNGLTARLTRVEDKVDRIIETQARQS